MMSASRGSSTVRWAGARRATAGGGGGRETVEDEGGKGGRGGRKVAGGDGGMGAGQCEGIRVES